MASTNFVFPDPVAPQGAYTWPIKKTPFFSTLISTPASQRGELRLALMPYPRWSFALDYNYIKGDPSTYNSALQNVLGFYIRMNGPANDWLYEDPYDNEVTVNTGTMSTAGAPTFAAFGDGVTTTFQLTRSIGGGIDIIQNLSNAPSIFVNGVLKTAGTDYSISGKGVIVFVSAPSVGATLTWSGNFYFRCRFEDDKWDTLNQFKPALWELKGLKFVSVLV